MRIFILAVMSSIALATPSLAGPAPGTCNKLAGDFDFIDRQVAMNFAEGVGDDSAPRATLRELRDLDGHTRQLMIIELMRAQGCVLSASVGEDAVYFSSALACATARLKGVADAPECKLSDWSRTDKSPKAH